MEFFDRHQAEKRDSPATFSSQERDGDTTPVSTQCRDKAPRRSGLQNKNNNKSIKNAKDSPEGKVFIH